MCEVVGKALPDEMVVLQSSKTMLEYGTLRTLSKSLQELRKSAGFFGSDAQQVRRGVEIKCLYRRMQRSWRYRACRHELTPARITSTSRLRQNLTRRFDTLAPIFSFPSASHTADTLGRDFCWVRSGASSLSSQSSVIRLPAQR